jgi:hypothetical protein
MCYRASMYCRATHVCLIPVPACINLFLVWISLSDPAPMTAPVPVPMNEGSSHLLDLVQSERFGSPRPPPKHFFFLPLYLSGFFFHPHTYPVHLATHLHPHPSYISTPSIFKGLFFWAMAANLATMRKNYWKYYHCWNLGAWDVSRLGVHAKGQ